MTNFLVQIFIGRTQIKVIDGANDRHTVILLINHKLMVSKDLKFDS